ncbi:sugar phosphate isomerase/epimerase family protein [Persicitalea jodogahamensis]|uniref:sugar phosphate isomerase/epimerase family protein n=1 Tax=Persicitalea jodogahamensis TaxID=402147 RepID=UPI001E496295|nr:sugar phosphate isomerase/epimerase family protein [Persicitalea jodogahamensis]
MSESVERYAAAGVKGISVWQNAVEGMSHAQAGELIRRSGLDVVSYVRGGFFPHTSQQEREKAIDHNKKLIEEAAALGAPLIVLVCGASPDQPLETSREQIQAGIEAILPLAQQMNVKLAIEPLHPMYAADRSAINTLAQANDLSESIGSPSVGVAVDVYHLWWEPNLEAEIKRCGKNGHLLAYHVCDWKVNTIDMLNDRGLMGEGCIDIKKISRWVDDTGFDGYVEVEIFSNIYWQEDQQHFLNKITQAFQEKV